MAEELQGLLDRITQDGLQKAESEKQKILDQANEEAKRLVEKAKSEADQILADARREIEKMRATGEAGLRQAARDLVISLETEIKTMMNAIVTGDVGTAMSPTQLAQIVSNLADAYTKSNGASKLEAMVSEKQLKELESAFRARLALKFRGGIELKPAPGVEAGIKVSFDGKSVVYDFSSEAVSEMLCAYLNPRLLSIIRNGASK